MILLESVSKRYDATPAVDGVSFRVCARDRVALLGPSGSGKTTLLRLIAGLELVDAGRILLSGRLASAPGRGVAPHKRGVGLVFQSPALWPHMTVAQHLLFALDRTTGLATRQRLSELAEQTGLTPLLHRYPHQLSGGEARRVALARTLAPRPGILLLDEPLTNLDDVSRDALLALIREHLDQGGATLLYVTHDEAEARGVAQRILRLDHGRLVGDETLTHDR